MRKVRGPWKVTSYRGAGELRDFIAQFQLHDVWVSKHGNELQATWSRGGSTSTIDKFLSRSELSSLLSVCEVVHFLKPQVLGPRAALGEAGVQGSWSLP